jgi:hypothetical protein
MNRRGYRNLARLLLVASMAAQTSPAAAQDASELVKQGLQLRREGHDAEALALFQQALGIDGTPRTRAQVALAEQALGLWVEAERDLSAALEAGDGTWFVQRREALNRALAAVRLRLAMLSVRTNVAGADVWINGVRVGTTPLPYPIRIVAGSVIVEARADGYALQTHHLEIDPGTQTSDRLELTRLVVDAPLESPAPREPAPGAAVRFRELPAAKETGRTTAGWILFGSAAALGIGGTAALLVRDRNATIYNDDGRCFYGDLTRDQRCGSYRDAVTFAQALAIAQFAAAGVGIAAGTLLLSGEPKDLHPRAASACVLGVGVTCKFTF